MKQPTCMRLSHVSYGRPSHRPAHTSCYSLPNNPLVFFSKVCVDALGLNAGFLSIHSRSGTAFCSAISQHIINHSSQTAASVYKCAKNLRIVKGFAPSAFLS